MLCVSSFFKYAFHILMVPPCPAHLSLTKDCIQSQGKMLCPSSRQTANLKNQHIWEKPQLPWNPKFPTSPQKGLFHIILDSRRDYTAGFPSSTELYNSFLGCFCPPPNPSLPVLATLPTDMSCLGIFVLYPPLEKKEIEMEKIQKP